MLNSPHRVVEFSEWSDTFTSTSQSVYQSSKTRLGKNLVDTPFARELMRTLHFTRSARSRRSIVEDFALLAKREKDACMTQ